MFVTKDEIRQIANDIITDDINNDILFIIANKGLGKYRLLKEIYNTHFQNDVIIVNGEGFNHESMVKNCLMHGIYEFLRRNNNISNRERLCSIVSMNGNYITVPRKFYFDFHVKISTAEMEYLLKSLSVTNLINIYNEFSHNTSLVVFIKGTELNLDDENYLKSAKSGKSDARITYIIALRPDENGVSLIKRVCAIRNERIWICSLVPTVSKQIANQKIVDIPSITLNDVQDSSSYIDFEKSIQTKDYCKPVFDLVSDLLSSNVNPSMIFTVANQEIEQMDFKYISDVTQRLLDEPSVSPNNSALISHNGKYIWVDALAYYIFVNRGIENLLLEMQRFYFSFLIDTNCWKDTLQENDYRVDVSASVLSMDDRDKMNDFLKNMSQAPDNLIIPSIADYTTRFSDWIRTFSRPCDVDKVHYSLMENLVDELFSFCIVFSDVNIEALQMISNETGRLGSLDIALLVTANKLKTKPKLLETEKSAIDKLIKKCMDEIIRWSDMTLVEELCDVFVLLKQINCLGTYHVPLITNNHVIYQQIKVLLERNNLDEGEIFMGRKTIFISYTGADGDVVEVIDNYLTECGYDVKRDIRDIGDYESIEKFMKGIRKQDFVIPIVSDSYLRRNNCMYEITQLIMDENYKDKTFPIVVNFAQSDERKDSFFHPLYRVEIISFWESETKRLRNGIENISAENRGELDLEIRRFTTYTQSVASFLDWISSNLVGIIPPGLKEENRKKKAFEIAEIIDEIIIKKTENCD